MQSESICASTGYGSKHEIEDLLAHADVSASRDERHLALIMIAHRLRNSRRRPLWEGRAIRCLEGDVKARILRFTAFIFFMRFQNCTESRKGLGKRREYGKGNQVHPLSIPPTLS
jgi:hypothetical protein